MEGPRPMKSFDATPEDPEAFGKALLVKACALKFKGHQLQKSSPEVSDTSNIEGKAVLHIKPGAAATFEMPKHMLIWKAGSDSLLGCPPKLCHLFDGMPFVQTVTTSRDLAKVV